MKKNNKKYRFSLDKYNINNKTAYYVCYDSKCEARGNIFIDYELLDNINFDIDELDKNFKLTKKHTIKYELHSYKRNSIIKIDYDNNDIKKEKLSDFKYCKSFVKEFVIRNDFMNVDMLVKKLKNEFPFLIDNINESEKEKLRKKYQTKKNKTDEQMKSVNFENILNFDILIKQALNNIHKMKNSKKNIHNLILNLVDNNNYNLTTLLTVQFKRKNKTYNKNIYLIMNKKMKENINLEGNKQYFADSTYKCCPPENKGLKLFIILYIKNQIIKNY